ncbi:MAG: hypothetical protein M3441_05340 [Chloroflexota bacterium]|nr:hypothetical protein [Chloroflexota bacterium]
MPGISDTPWLIELIFLVGLAFVAWYSIRLDRRAEGRLAQWAGANGYRIIYKHKSLFAKRFISNIGHTLYDVEVQDREGIVRRGQVKLHNYRDDILESTEVRWQE